MKRIQLSRAYKLANQERDYLEMREPRVKDNLAVADIKHNEDREVQMLANLCDVDRSELEELTLNDYGVLTDAFLGFLGTPLKNFEAPSSL